MNQYANDFTNTVKIYYDDLKKYKPLTKAKEKRLLKLSRKGNLKAKNEILESNLKFVFDIAKHYTGRGLSISELSTIPVSNILTYDEVWGRVAKANYENMKNLIEKVAKQYEAVFLISHSDEVRDWCDCHVSVVKENNISKVVLK